MKNFTLCVFILFTCVAVIANTHGFTVNEQGDKVLFSPGNLQFNAALGEHQCADGKVKKGTWRFAEHQCDFVGGTYVPPTGTFYIDSTSFNSTVFWKGQKCNNSKKSENYDGWIDLFCFGPSGWDNTANDPYAIHFEPWSISHEESSNPLNKYGFGPSTDRVDINAVGTSAWYDWGQYNQIGTDTPGTWRLPTFSEWEYLLSKRPNASQLYSLGSIIIKTPMYSYSKQRYVEGLYNDTEVKGLFILPDDWQQPEGTTFNPYSRRSYNNTYTYETDWQIMEQAGAIFLPQAGSQKQSGRDGEICESVEPLMSYYCTSTRTTLNDYTSYDFIFIPTLFLYGIGDIDIPTQLRTINTGISVRLVKDIIPEPPMPTQYVSVVLDTLCQNQSYDSKIYQDTGIFALNTDTVKSVSGDRDSIITSYNLKVVPAYRTEINDTIQVGDTYPWHNNVLDSQGTYKDTLPTIYGCDSITILHLTVITPPVDTVLTDTITPIEPITPPTDTTHQDTITPIDPITPINPPVDTVPTDTITPIEPITPINPPVDTIPQDTVKPIEPITLLFDKRHDETPAVYKKIEAGQIIIINNGIRYNIFGKKVEE